MVKRVHVRCCACFGRLPSCIFLHFPWHGQNSNVSSHLANVVPSSLQELRTFMPEQLESSFIRPLSVQYFVSDSSLRVFCTVFPAILGAGCCLQTFPMHSYLFLARSTWISCAGRPISTDEAATDPDLVNPRLVPRRRWRSARGLPGPL